MSDEPAEKRPTGQPFQHPDKSWDWALEKIAALTEEVLALRVTPGSAKLYEWIGDLSEQRKLLEKKIENQRAELRRMWEGPAAGSKAAKAWTDMQRGADRGVRALALLREVEWSEFPIDPGECCVWCPFCERYSSNLRRTPPKGGHAHDCKLAALLEESNG